jgi:ERF superfamily
MTGPEQPTVRELFVRVMREVRSIEKSSYNKDQKYRFRGIEAVLETIGPLVREHGLIVLPESSEIVAEERYQSKSGSAMRSVTVRVTWSITGPAGDEMTAQTLGEAADASDKAIAKAQSVAGRVLWLSGLWVPTGDPDPDEVTHERAPQQRQQQRQRGPAPDPERPRVDGPLRKALGADIARLGTVVLGRTQTDLYAQFARTYGTTVVEASTEQLGAFRDLLRGEAERAAQAPAEEPAKEPAGDDPAVQQAAEAAADEGAPG